MITLVFHSDDAEEVYEWVMDAVELDSRVDRSVNVHRIEPEVV